MLKLGSSNMKKLSSQNRAWAQCHPTHQPCALVTKSARPRPVPPLAATSHVGESAESLGISTAPWSPSRRAQLAMLAAVAGLALAPNKATASDDTAESATTTSSPATNSGSSPASRAADAIRRDFVERQYYVTGLLSRDLFAPDCVFIDPTVEVTGVEPYVRALQALFDPARSRADLLSLTVTGPSTLALRWRLEGALRLGGLRIKPYTGTTVYTLDGEGRVVRHEETWDISTLDAFVSTIFPGFGAPPAPPVAPSPSA